MAPAPKLPRNEYDWRYRNKTGGQVQGAKDRRPGQRPETVAEQVARKARERADRNQKKPPPKDKPGSGVKGLTTRVPAPVSKNNSQPGPGPSGTGAGRDTPGAGKERGQFEQDRQRDRGTGKDRPPVYKPPTDYRGGYQTSAKKGTDKPIHEQVRDADEKTKQKIRDILDGKSDTTTAPRIPAPQKKKLPSPGSSTVRGLTLRV
jgi:hypothetical protein